MGTRGYVGFVLHGAAKAQYNHSDSYPDGLGLQVLRDLKEANLTVKQMRELFHEIEPVDEDVVPPEELQQRYRDRGLTDTTVSRGTSEDWYCLLRNTQGGLKAWLSGECTHMIVTQNLQNVPYCYLVDLNDGELQAYRGGYGQEIELVASWPLDNLPTDEQFLAPFE